MLDKIIKKSSGYTKLQAFGLDISDISVKYMKLAANKNLKFESFGEISLPKGFVENGEIKKEEELKNFLKKYFHEEVRPVRTKYLVASLPEEKSFLRVIQMPRVKPEEVANAIRWELEANVPLPLEEIYFDYEVVEPPGGALDHYDILIIAFPKAIIDSYLRVLRGANFLPVALELEAQSIARAITSEKDANEAVIIVDMGATRTTFILFAGRTITFTLTINFGGKDFHSVISRNVGVSLEEAEKIKKEVGLSRKEMDGKVYEALIPALGPIVDELKREIAYYQEHLSHRHGASPKITKVYLCGGEASLIGLVPYLAVSLHTPVEVGDPFSNLKKRMRLPIPPIAKNKSLAYTTAIGLALRAIE